MSKPLLIDTHAHLYLDAFDDDRPAMVQRALDHGVKKLLLPNIDNSTIDAMLEMEDRFPAVCFPMMGLHPCSVGEDNAAATRIIEQWLASRPFVAVGEIGTDLYWDKTWVEAQIGIFKWHLALAREAGLPVVIHSRDSLDLNIGIVREMQDGRLTGVFHCFNGTAEQAQQITDLGFHMGIGGVVTFKNAGVDQVVASLPLGNLVLETDAPYLTPVPFRGQRNESAYLVHVAQKLADVTGISLEQVAAETTRNAEALFPGITAQA
ncbi:MAG: TatD family hydrolase [Saprospiraceae bacterium]|nr:TatD family hydrolase [Saprospiraceae bacterium]